MKMTDEEILASFEPVTFVDVGMNVWTPMTVDGRRVWVNGRVTMAAGHHARIYVRRHGGMEVMRHIDDLRRLPTDLQRQLTAPSADRIAARGGLDL